MSKTDWRRLGFEEWNRQLAEGKKPDVGQQREHFLSLGGKFESDIGSSRDWWDYTTGFNDGEKAYLDVLTANFLSDLKELCSLYNVTFLSCGCGCCGGCHMKDEQGREWDITGEVEL